MWRLLNGLLPIPNFLRRLGFHLPSKCLFCLAENTLTHAFFACPVASSVWKFFMVEKLGINFAAIQDFGDFLCFLWDEKMGSSKGRVAYILTLLITWALWKARNKFLFDEGTPTAGSVIKEVWTFLLDLHRIHGFQCMGAADRLLVDSGLLPSIRPARRSAPKIVYWELPRPPEVKLNIDGSALGSPGPAGCGFIIRDHNGMVLYAASIFIGVATNSFAEFIALYHGLQACAQLGMQKVIIESDSRYLVEAIHGRWAIQWDLHHIFRLIQKGLSPLDMRVQHNYREGNASADYLAKLASMTGENITYSADNLPETLARLVASDLSHIPFIRL